MSEHLVREVGTLTYCCTGQLLQGPSVTTPDGLGPTEIDISNVLLGIVIFESDAFAVVLKLNKDAIIVINKEAFIRSGIKLSPVVLN
ncbi:hypothetical protein [Sessilibacter corallicola]|uniref:Uncharacterized protein n=1 Tax=Sessilibacter corallicola TaxID=2904075 RepID=A0ABQ0A7U8_9GAMM